MPRLAQIKLEGPAHAAAMAAQHQTRIAGVVAAGLVLLCGATVGGVLLLGGKLIDLNEALHAGADHVAAAAGFEAKVVVDGVEGARAQEVQDEVLPQGRNSIVAGSPHAVKARVESLDWVARAQVSRLWPSTIRVTVERRKGLAVWRNGASEVVIDAAGEPVHNERPGDNRTLVRVVGPGAGAAAAPLVVALEEMPQVRAELGALERIGDRRWDLITQSGMRVLLPERDPIAALRLLEKAQTRRALLTQPFAEIDLRVPGQPRATPQAAAASPQNVTPPERKA
jgi:cell division protein FtsQ